MANPIISYSAKLHDYKEYNDVDEIYGGTYTPKKSIQVDIRIWNNKYGLSDVDDLEEFVINFYFGNYEDAALLQFLSVTYDDISELSLDIVDGVATGVFIDNYVLSGKANNGLDSDKDNYVDLLLEFAAGENISLKNLDMKSLYVEIVEKE